MAWKESEHRSAGDQLSTDRLPTILDVSCVRFSSIPIVRHASSQCHFHSIFPDDSILHPTRNRALDFRSSDADRTKPALRRLASLASISFRAPRPCCYSLVQRMIVAESGFVLWNKFVCLAVAIDTAIGLEVRHSHSIDQPAMPSAGFDCEGEG